MTWQKPDTSRLRKMQDSLREAQQVALAEAERLRKKAEALKKAAEVLQNV